MPRYVRNCAAMRAAWPGVNWVMQLRKHVMLSTQPVCQRGQDGAEPVRWHSPVIRVVHVVVDRVKSRARARVASCRAATGGSRLCGGVGHHVACTAATTLEGVVQTNPMTGFMSQSLGHVLCERKSEIRTFDTDFSLVEIRGASTRKRGEQDDATIVCWVFGIVGREGRESQETYICGCCETKLRSCGEN